MRSSKTQIHVHGWRTGMRNRPRCRIWRQTNGELLTLAESKFDVLVTIDKNIRHQQNLADRKIAVLILHASSNDLSDISPLVPKALAALQSIQPGKFADVGNSS